MGKYIDAEKLKAEIRKLLIPTVHDRDYDEWEHGRDSGFIEAISIIDSLQQEQLEVDLEEAAKHVYESWMGGTMDDVRRDMVELGRVINARKEE